VPLPKQVLASFIPEFVKHILEFTELKDLQYDLIHSHYWMSGIAAEALKEKWSVPIVHMFHTLGEMKQRIASSPDENEGDYRLSGERQVLRVADRIVAATQAESAQLLWLYDADTDKIVIIPPGVDVSHFYPIPNDEAKEFVGVSPCDRLLLYVGRIEPLKGIDILIHAIALMRQKGIKICLSVIGGSTSLDPDFENNEMARLQLLREQVGLLDLVAFLGKREQESLPYYYSAADAVVVPSHYESFGMVALEAMACGTPVVASQVGGLAFLVRDGVTGFTVPVDDPEELAAYLIKLVDDEDLRKTMGLKASEFAKDYAWDKIADQIIALYNEVVERKVVV
jgi:D-inositol-3-phosphate glycosyltransferase